MQSLVAARRCAILLASLLCACDIVPANPVPATPQIVFVCEHGNVKSLIAATYFNQLAAQRGLTVRAIARGIAPDSDTVPPKVAAALLGEGFDVSGFHPAPVTAADASASLLVVPIGSKLSAEVAGAAARTEPWNDVPPASVDYAAASAALKQHVELLLEELGDR